MDSMDTSRSTAQALVRFLGGMTLPGLPATVVARAKWCLLDSIGCGLFGAQQEWARILREEMYAEGAPGASSVLGGGRTLAAPAAALCNGTATHGFELDDLLDEAIVHPGAIIVPAVLAAAEAADAPGARVVLGIVAGYEVLNRIGLALGVEPAHRGFHKTALAGPVGAAVAAGVVTGLSASRLMTAAGLACSTASGIKSFAAGAGGGMMKRMHAGRAAESGVRMAQLAARDFSAPHTAIDGRFGLLEVYGGAGARPDLLGDALGRRWAFDEVYVKVYPCCSWIQSTVQQLVALRGGRPLDPAAIRRVRVGVSAYAAKNNGEPAPPDTMGAQYSIPYCAALALAGDPEDPAMYAQGALEDRGRRELARRVELEVDAELDAAYPKHYGARVRLELASGEIREGFVLDPHGMPADPCTEAERHAKFTRLAGSTLGAGAVDALRAAVLGVEALGSARELGRLLRA